MNDNTAREQQQQTTTNTAATEAVSHLVEGLSGLHPFELSQNQPLGTTATLVTPDKTAHAQQHDGLSSPTPALRFEEYLWAHKAQSANKLKDVSRQQDQTKQHENVSTAFEDRVDRPGVGQITVEDSTRFSPQHRNNFEERRDRRSSDRPSLPRELDDQELYLHLLNPQQHGDAQDKFAASHGIADKILVLRSQQSSQRKPSQERLLASDLSNRCSSNGRETDLSNVNSAQYTTLTGHYEFLKQLSNSNKASAARSVNTASVISGARDESAGGVDASHQSILMDQQFLEMKAKYLLSLGGMQALPANEAAADESHTEGRASASLKELVESPSPRNLFLSSLSNIQSQQAQERQQPASKGAEAGPPQTPMLQKQQHQLEVYSNIVAQLKRQKKQNSENPKKPTAQTHEGELVQLSSLVSASNFSGRKEDLASSGHRIPLNYSDSISQVLEGSQKLRSPNTTQNNLSHLKPRTQKQLQLVKALSQGQHQQSTNEDETQDFKLSETMQQNNSISENDERAAEQQPGQQEQRYQPENNTDEANKNEKAVFLSERQQSVEDADPGLVLVFSNDGGNTNRGDLTSARIARQLAVEIEQSQHQRTFLQSFLTQRTQMSMLASQAQIQANAPSKQPSPFESGSDKQLTKPKVDGEQAAEEWPNINLKHLAEPDDLMQANPANTHKIQFLNRVELLKQKLFMKSDSQASSRGSSLALPSNSEQAPRDTNPEELLLKQPLKSSAEQSEVEQAQEKRKPEYEYHSDNSEDHIILNNLPQVTSSHKVDEILHIDLLDSAMKISRTQQSASVESSDGPGPSATGSRPSGPTQANQLPKNNAVPSMDALSRANQNEAEAVMLVGKLPTARRTKDSSGDLFDFSEILQNEKRQNDVAAVPEGQRQIDLGSDFQRELLSLPSDVGLEVRMQQLECCEGTGGSGGTSLVTQHLYEQLQSRHYPQKQEASAPGSQPQPERKTTTAALERSRNQTENSLRLTNFSLDLPSKIHHEEFTQDKNQRSPGPQVHTPMSNQEAASNHFGYSSSRISYQFLPSCQQISFAHTTSFSKKGSDGDPNAPDGNAIHDSDEKQQRKARLAHQESLPSELNKDQMIFLDQQRDPRRSIAGKQQPQNEGMSHRPPSCISLKSLKGLVIPNGSNLHGMGTAGAASGRMNTQPFEQGKFSVDSTKSMKSRELMASNEKVSRISKEYGPSTFKSDGKSVNDADSRDSARQSVGSESNGAILRNQATDIKQLYTTQILTVTEKRSESYIKINSGRNDAHIFNQKSEAAQRHSGSSSSLLEPPFNDKIGAAEVPRKTDQIKKIDEGVKWAAEQDFGFDEERFLRQMQLRESVDSRPSSVALNLASEWQRPAQPPPTAMMQKQRMIEYENQILKLKQLVEQFEQDKIAQEAKTKKAEQERNDLAKALQECQQSLLWRSKEAERLQERIEAIQNDYEKVFQDEGACEQVLRKWLEMKGTNESGTSGSQITIGQFNIMTHRRTGGDDKAAGIERELLESKKKETAQAAVQTETLELSAPLSHAAPVQTIFERVREKNLESLRSALKQKKPKGQSFAAADPQQAPLAAESDRRVYKSFNQREVYGPVVRSAHQACEHIGEVTESYNLTTCHDASNTNPDKTMMKSRSFVMSCSDNQTDRPPFTKCPDANGPLENPACQYRTKLKIKKQSSASSFAGTGGSNRVQQSMSRSKKVQLQASAQHRSRSRSCASDQPSPRSSHPNGSIRSSCEQPSLETPKNTISNHYSLSCQFNEQLHDKSLRSPARSKASSGNRSKNHDLSDELEQVDVGKQPAKTKAVVKNQKKPVPQSVAQKQVPGRALEFTSQSQLKTYKLFNQQNLNPAGTLTAHKPTPSHACSAKPTPLLSAQAPKKRIPASPNGWQANDNGEDQHIYTTGATKHQRVPASGRALGSASSCKSFKSLQMGNSKASPLNLNLTLKKQISNPKNDQILLNIARKLKQKREGEEQLSGYNSMGTLEKAASAQRPRDLKRIQQMKRHEKRVGPTHELLSSPKSKQLFSSNVNELYYSTQQPLNPIQKQPATTSTKPTEKRSRNGPSTAAQRDCSQQLRKRKSPSKSHRSPARVPVASSIINAGMLFSDLKSPSHAPCHSQFHTLQTAANDHSQTHFSHNILNASNSKFETSVGIIHKEYFTMDNIEADDLDQSERRVSGEITSGRSHVRQPHTTRSISSIKKESAVNESGTVAAKVMVGSVPRGAGASLSLKLLHQ